MDIRTNSAGTWLDLGFAIGTTPEGVIEDNAYDRAVYDNVKILGVDKNGKITQNGWNHINEDCEQLERRLIKEINRVTGIIFREEGHDGSGDLLGSCWVNLDEHPDVLKFIHTHSGEIDNEPYSEPHEMEGVSDKAIYKGLYPVTRNAVDVEFSFIDITEEQFELLDDIKELPIEEAIEILKKQPDAYDH